MMTDHRDPVLQSLFAVDQVELNDKDGQVFTACVMAKTRKLIYVSVASLVGIALIFLVSAWLFGIPIKDLAYSITGALATTLFDLGEGWASWILTPVNNIASLLVLSLKAMRVIWKKVTLG